MKKLLIVGAGGFGREAWGMALESLGYGSEFKVKGFLDAKADALDAFAGYPPVVGDPATYVPQEGDVFITALGSISARRRCVAALEGKGAEFATLVHRSAFLGPNVTVGEGSLIAPGVSLTADVMVGRHADIFHNTSVGHDSQIGDFAHIYAQCAIGGGVKVGSGASVYPGSVVVPRRRIGEDSTVGAGSCVFLDVPSATTVHGNPAAPVE
ncbi:MAG: NeuD/PglB/VioB family sugar acetyltransferase [Kiritimatiellae bacterium]|nr:NeuD/PglB/VioB family sugar acetyltransferase [Kiritimatiellia bacterium]